MAEECTRMEKTPDSAEEAGSIQKRGHVCCGRNLDLDYKGDRWLLKDFKQDNNILTLRFLKRLLRLLKEDRGARGSEVRVLALIQAKNMAGCIEGMAVEEQDTSGAMERRYADRQRRLQHLFLSYLIYRKVLSL